ncbi:thioesterase family protein [Pokkaliibacter sp. CJK22405]|uniref:thioesterase family protein n=1 Tax=Pokkaliibacter sp. CJK22405 TaxID=3384615 RepID=UPI003984FD85
MSETLCLYQGPVKDQWIDYNGHMNDACYVVVFSQAIDLLMDHLGIDAVTRDKEQVSIYTLQSMVHYLQEVTAAEPLRVEAQLLEHDGKKLRVFFTMVHGDSGDTLAAMETLLLHMDMAAHRAAPFLPAVQQKVEQLALSHQSLTWPALAGRSIALKRPT